MHLSGKTILLQAGDYTATIVTIGGAIASLKYLGHDIIMPWKPESVPEGYQGKILAPWPNRIPDGIYTFANKEYSLPINDKETQCASHGLVAWQEWSIKSMSASGVELQCFIPPQPGYPFLISLQANYELIEGMGLKIDITAQNVGKEDAPYGIGMHPYITIDGQLIDECVLSMPFTRAFALSERKIPTEVVSVDDLGFNFQKPRAMGAVEIDHCFISEGAARMNTVMLENKDLKVYCKSNAPFMQLYTPDKLGRKCLAVEPMTCAANAFNNGYGLITLKEHQLSTLTYIIGAVKQV